MNPVTHLKSNAKESQIFMLGDINLTTDTLVSTIILLIP